MLKNIIIVGFLSFAVTFNSYAHDSDRIDQLEKEIQQITLRLSKLESLLGNPSNAQNPATDLRNKSAASGEGWKSLSSWRKLAAGMSTSDVRKILGEPQQVDGGISASWYYQNGVVMFHKGKVYRWIETGQ